jgi:CheY-like chemotaxis protein
LAGPVWRKSGGYQSRKLAGSVWRKFGNGSVIVSFNKKTHQSPIVICSSGNREEYEDLYDFETDHTLNQYVRKPFEINLLINIVKQALNATIDEVQLISK